MRVTKLGKEENMARNLFNLKTLLPLDIQMLADGGEGTPQRKTHHQEMT